MNNYLLFTINLLFSFFLMERIYQILLNKNIYDVPNQRSLHSKPKIRGGGLSILISFILFLIVFYLNGRITGKMLYPILTGGLIISTIGWFDDLKGISINIRLFFHILSIIIILYIFNGFNVINLAGKSIKIFFIGNIFFLLYAIWMINLYNFMDGVDGIAISQLIFPSLFLTVYFGIQKNYEITAVSTVMICSAIPFYRYNWPPSKMFMGDVLSGFLGFYFASMTLYINNYLNQSFLLIPVLLSPFIFDATFTLIKRLINREKVWIAHNSHYYQQFAKVYGHKKVTLTIILLNIFLYIPALLIVTYREFDLFIAISTYFFIAIFIFIFKKFFLSDIKTINNYSTGL